MNGWSFKSWFFLLPILLISACSGTPLQLSGIVAIANLDTVACVPKAQIIQIRNSDTEQPQRVQGVHFELGTNDFDKEGKKPGTLMPGEDYFHYFNVDQVTVGNVTKAGVSNLVEEMILPPGGVMTIQVSYNPRAITQGEDYHNTYLDVVLNGPKLGVMQFELRGKALSAAPGCGETIGKVRPFQVLGVKTTLSHVDLGQPVVTDLNVAEAVEGNFELNELPDGKIVLTQTGWPRITFPLPEGAPIPDLSISLSSDSDPVTLGSDGKIAFEGLDFNGSNVVSLNNLKLTTDSITFTSAEAPNVSGGSITFTGSALNDQGEITLVVAAALTVPPVDTTEKVGGGVFGMELTLKEIK